MKIERIDDNKIKVTISTTDLMERDLDLSALNYNSPAAQELFWDMMEQAEVQFGFNASDSQLCIEAVPDSGEGFIVTITKVDEDGDFESIHKYIKNKFRNTDIKVKKKSKKLSSTSLVYSFNNFDELCELCKNLYTMYAGDSTLYKCKNTYYLLLTRNNLLITNPRLFEAMLNEYGNKINNVSFYEGYLNEYGIKIIEYNAIETLNGYF